MASIVISDTHFGLDSSTLKSPAKVEQWVREVREVGCDEVILLGDIFDFWRVRPERAMRASLPFFRRLYELGPAVRYVLGNHDHHLVVQKQESELMERAARGDLYPVYAPFMRWIRTFAGLEMEMLYPAFRARLRHSTLIFTHGHHLDGISTLTLQVVEKLRSLSGMGTTPSDQEMMMTYAYESIYRSAGIDEVVSFENTLWKASNLLLRLNSSTLSHPHRASVEGQYDVILSFIAERHLGRVDCFIYGDTHRAGLFQRGEGPLAVNSGTLTRPSDNSSGPETPDTYLILDEGLISVRRLGRKRPLAQCELV